MISIREDGMNRVINNNSSGQKYLIVAGGAGYIGKYFVKNILLLEKTLNIIVVTRNFSKKMFFKNDRVEFVSNFKNLTIENCDIFNFVYSPSISYKKGKKISYTYLSELFNCLSENYQGTIFHISSIAVYSSQSTINIPPPSKLKHIKKNDPYSYIKSKTEYFLEKKCNENKIKYKIFRVGNVIGPGSVWVNLIISRLQNKLPLIGDKVSHPSNSTFIGNLIHILYKSYLSNNSNRYYNVCEFGDVSWEEWVNIFKKQLSIEPVRWGVDHVDNFNFGLMLDLRSLKQLIYKAIAPNLVKLPIVTNLIYKLYDFFNKDLEKSKIRAKKNISSSANQTSLSLKELELAKVYLQNSIIKVEGFANDELEDLPYSFTESSKVLKDYLSYNEYEI